MCVTAFAGAEEEEAQTEGTRRGPTLKSQYYLADVPTLLLF